MRKYGDWEAIEPPLGEGGQSVVYRARTPSRVAEREQSFKLLSQLAGGGLRDLATAEHFARASWDLARPDSPSELGALKIFKIRQGGAPAEERLKREIAVLREGRPRLPKLLDANESEQWLVTEYFPRGTIGKSPFKYMGQPILALRAFRTLVETVATSLHKDKIVHRDIKPDNIFYGNDGSLIPGDFGIVYMPDQAQRVTVTDERVGPWEYMPQWADSGVRYEAVEPNFDVYMLGKLLWCMVAGRLRLPREYHRRAPFDLTVMFPNNKQMNLINAILDKCLVDSPEHCLPSAGELLKIVEESLVVVDQGVPLLDGSGKLILPCRVCGKGFYLPEMSSGNRVRLQTSDEYGRQVGLIDLQIFRCNVCTHREFFAPNFPDEAAKKGWKPSP